MFDPTGQDLAEALEVLKASNFVGDTLAAANIKPTRINMLGIMTMVVTTIKFGKTKNRIDKMQWLHLCEVLWDSYKNEDN